MEREIFSSGVRRRVLYCKFGFGVFGGHIAQWVAIRAGPPTAPGLHNLEAERHRLWVWVVVMSVDVWCKNEDNMQDLIVEDDTVRWVDVEE